MSFTSKVSVWCINQANVLIHAVNHLSVPLLFSVALILTIIWIVGKKLSRFSKPENPKVSRIIRDVSSVLSPIAFAVIIL